MSGSGSPACDWAERWSTTYEGVSACPVYTPFVQKRWQVWPYLRWSLISWWHLNWILNSINWCCFKSISCVCHSGGESVSFQRTEQGSGCSIKVLTRSMTENVSWYAAIFLFRFQETLAVSSPCGWSTSLAMSARSMPGWRHDTESKRYIPTKTALQSESGRARYPPAVNILPAPDSSTTLQSGFPAISLKRSTISLGGEKKLYWCNL